jgi:cytochrome c553
MFDFVGVGILVLLAALFGWLTTRAWGARRAWVKWPGVAVCGLLAVVAAVLVAAAVNTFVQVSLPRPNPAPDIRVAGTPEQIARGEKLALICANCHSPDGQPAFSGTNLTEGAPPIGTLYAANLTPAHLESWSDGEIIRAIREGVHKSGRSLIVMPSQFFRSLSDADVQALVAFLRSLPPAEPDTPATQLNVLGAVMFNLYPVVTAQDAVPAPVASPPEGASPEYGGYLVSITLCQECHGRDLAGGVGGMGPPAGPNLTTLVRTWTEAQFVDFFRTGQLPSGSPAGSGMPWEMVSEFASDDDLKAMYAYLSSLPPREGPAR